MARAAKMTPEARQDSARKAAIARWRKEEENGIVGDTGNAEVDPL